MFQSLFNIKN